MMQYSIPASKYKIVALQTIREKPEGATCESKTSDMDCNEETETTISVIEERSLLLKHRHPAAVSVYTGKI